MVRIRIDNNNGKILTPLTLDQLSVISNICSFKVEGSEYKANAFKNKSRGGFKWDGHRRLFNSQHQTFPIGLLHRILHLLDTVSMPVEIIDDRRFTDRKFDIKCNVKQDRPYQHDVTLKSILNGSGIVKSATGSGKTTMAGMAISAFGKDAVFLVHTKDLLYQAKESFEAMFNEDIGQIGDGIVDLKRITVATIQTLAKVLGIKYSNYKYDEDATNDEKELPNSIKYKSDILKWAKSISVVLFDEVQRVCSKTAYGVRFMFMNAEHTFGYSASPWRDDGSDLMIEATFGQRICDISASQLIDEGYLVQPTIMIKKIYDNVWDGKSYNSIYKSAVVENTFRNMQIVQDAIELYDEGRPTLVLVTQVKHGEKIESMIRYMNKPAQFISGKSGMRHRKQVIDDMRKGKAPLVIATTIADVGLDVPRISGIVEGGAGKSSVTALQRLGRIMRPFPEKEDCVFRTYRDTAPFLVNHIDKKISIWRTEPRFIIKEV